MPTKTGVDPIHKAKVIDKVKGLPKKPQGKTSNPIKDYVPPGAIRTKRVSKQNQLREQMEDAASEVIELMTEAIKTGLLGGVLDKEGNPMPPDKISNTMRIELMKNFLPYVLPALKSVEYVETQPKDLQPLVINMHGGQASISTDGKSTNIELDSSDQKDPIEGKEKTKLIN